jgi:hypothetical protein
MRPYDLGFVATVLALPAMLFGTLQYLAPSATAAPPLVEAWETKRLTPTEPTGCSQHFSRQTPLEDRPTAADRERLKACESDRLYWGVGIKADPAEARRCAFIEAESEENSDPLRGEGMLMMIYANGRGARQDFGVAMNIACRIWERDGGYYWVDRLASFDATRASGDEFEFCDHVTVSADILRCVSHDAAVRTAQRKAELRALVRGWWPAEKRALRILEAKLDSWVQAELKAVAGGASLLTDAIALSHSESLRDQYFVDLRSLAAGRIAESSEQAAVEAERRMNRA